MTHRLRRTAAAVLTSTALAGIGVLVSTAPAYAGIIVHDGTGQEQQLFPPGPTATGPDVNAADVALVTEGDQGTDIIPRL